LFRAELRPSDRCIQFRPDAFAKAQENWRVNIELQAVDCVTSIAMYGYRNDIALLIALRRAIDECQNTINQSRPVIESSLDAIALLDRLRDGRPADVGHEPRRSAPTSSATRNITTE
jgi:hypothetical protein